MIIDKTSNIDFYAPLLQNLAAGMAALNALGDQPACGRYEFEGGFFMIQEGDTTPMEEGNFESHKNYIDVQIMLHGAEEVAWQDLGDTTEVTPYSPEKDIAFEDGVRSHSALITDGMFYAVFPHDAHRPSAHTSKSHHFLKAVMKLPASK